MSQQKIAQLISIIFHPFIWIFLGLLVVTVKESASIENRLIILLSLMLFSLLLPFVLLWVHRRRGGVSDFFLTDPKERSKFIIIALTITLPILISSLFFVKLPKAITLVMFLLFINTAIYLFVTRFIKMSAHIGVVNSVALGLSFLYGAHFLFLLLLEIPIAWARYKLKHHSLFEMFSAFIVSSVLTFLIFFRPL